MVSSSNQLEIDTIGETVLGNGPFGIGVFAKKQFLSGDPILLMAGKTVSFDYTKNDDNLENGYPMQIGENQYMDLVNNGKYLNHSCDPNSALTGGFVIIAIKTIEIGEEILFDYSTTMNEDFWTMRCRCGSSKCRGIVQDFKYISSADRKWYSERGYLSEHLTRLFDQNGEPRA